MTDTVSLPTQEEIIARYESRVEADMFGFETEDYLRCLDWGNAKEFLHSEVNEEKWNEVRWEHSRESLLKKMEDYLEFAFDKAYSERGISANRSIMHYIAWTWLAGDRQFSEEIEREYQDNYYGYGLSILRRVCEFYGWNEPK